VTPRYPPVSSGGGEQSAHLLATSLGASDRIRDITVLSFDGQERTTVDGIDVHRLTTAPSTVTEYQNVVAARAMGNRLADFDVVHGYNMELHPAIGYRCSRSDVVSVATLNSYHFFKSSVTNTTASGLQRLYELVGYPTTGRILRHYMKQIDAFVALSHAIEEIYRTNGFPTQRFEHIPNMIDPDFSIPDRGEESNRYELLYVGTLTENKGVEYLVRAVQLLPEDCQLRIVGSGPEGAALRSLATDCGVEDQITFEGQVPYEQVGSFYADADLFVHPGIWPEPFNRTVLEAMQAGLPVVSTDIGGPPEAIDDDHLLCKPGDHESLAAAVRRAREITRNVGARNRDYVAENHAPDVTVPKIVDLYEALLKEA
jgi:glycosyltransferase involved in cell wall biosynthesis